MAGEYEEYVAQGLEQESKGFLDKLSDAWKELTNNTIRNQNTKSMGFMQYPMNSDDVGGVHWLTFKAYKTEAADKFTPSVNSYKTTIKLPIPANLVENYSLIYTQRELQPVGNEIQKLMSNGKPFQDNIGQALKTVGANFAFNGLTKVGDSIATAAGAPDLDTKRLLTGVVGAAINPHKVVYFDQVNFKQHQFEYIFVPRNRRESDEISRLINAFRYHAAPGFVNVKLAGQDVFNKHLFDYPEYWKIYLSHETYYFSFLPCFLTDIRVNYTPSGVPTFVNDALGEPAPSQVNISLSFQEAEIMTKDNYNNKNYTGINSGLILGGL